MPQPESIAQVKAASETAMIDQGASRGSASTLTTSRYERNVGQSVCMHTRPDIDFLHAPCVRS